MTSRFTRQLKRALVLSGAVLALTAAEGHAGGEHYKANLQPLNAEKIGTEVKGTADLTIADGKLKISIAATGLTPGLMHLQHFHGFPDGKDAACPTLAADANGDGYIDLIETEPVAGTTMVPFHSHPVTLEIPDHTYPVADDSGGARYQNEVSVAELEKALQEQLKASALDLEKRVIFIHGVAKDVKLPETVKSLPDVPAQITLPVACGKIEAVK